ncbi:MAG: hypothetical protein P4L54_04955 [Acidocella sp.]|nr:hypothetical protein [Acidocella sp.]
MGRIPYEAAVQQKFLEPDQTAMSGFFCATARNAGVWYCGGPSVKIVS